MTRGPEHAFEQEERLKAMADGLVSQAGCIARAAAELQQAVAECGSALQESGGASDLYDLNEIAGVMAKALLAWSCDPRRPVDRGLDVWERAAIVEMAVKALGVLRRI